MSNDVTLIFIDGENLVFRYQEMIAEGRTPAVGNIHIPDCFIWNQRILDDHLWNIKRVAYHTSVVGDNNKVRKVRSQIATTTFSCQVDGLGESGETSLTKSGQIVPFVRKIKGVGVNLPQFDGYF